MRVSPSLGIKRPAMRVHTPRHVKELAKQLRQRQTPAEKLLWERLRDNGLDGHKFYRQCPIGRYIADFYCRELRLVIELDGGIHDERRQQEYDALRQAEIEGRGIRVLRIPNERIIHAVHDALSEIKAFCTDTQQPTDRRHYGI